MLSLNSLHSVTARLPGIMIKLVKVNSYFLGDEGFYFYFHSCISDENKNQIPKPFAVTADGYCRDTALNQRCNREGKMGGPVLPASTPNQSIGSLSFQEITLLTSSFEIRLFFLFILSKWQRCTSSLKT